MSSNVDVITYSAIIANIKKVIPPIIKGLNFNVNPETNVPIPLIRRVNIEGCIFNVREMNTDTKKEIAKTNQKYFKNISK